MDFKYLINAINKSRNIIIKEFSRDKIMYQGNIKSIPLKILNKNWLVAEVILKDKSNYNSDYIITIY